VSIERWELVPSSRADRYLLRVRGDRAEVDAIVRAYSRVCEEPREISDPVFQWAIYVVDATLNERLAIQDQLRNRMTRSTEPSLVAPVDLSGVLAELSLVLEELTGLTDEEQAHVAKKMQEIQQREAEQAAAPLPPPPVPPQEPERKIVLDVAPRTPPVREPAPPKAAPVPPPPSPEPPAVPKPSAAPSLPPSSPPPASPPPVEAASVSAPLPPAPPSPDVPPDQLLRAVFFYAEGAENQKNKFVEKLTDVAQKKAKKPLFIHPVASRATALVAAKAGEWIQTSRSSGADCFFVLLTPDVLPDFLERAANEARQSGLHCFLVPQAELESRLLYVDLMVELMLIKRKR